MSSMKKNKISNIINDLDIIFDYIYSILRLILKPIVSFIWIRKISGLNNIPNVGSVLLAMNHQSYFDFLCVAAISPRNVHFLAAEKFFDHWLWKHLMMITRQVRVNRNQSDKTELHNIIHEHIDHGRIIGIFPEGTRSPHEHLMLKAFTGVAQYSLRKKIPIIPIGIKGAYTVMSKHDKRPKFIKCVEINIGEPIHFIEHYDNHNDEIYNDVTNKIMRKIGELSNKQYPY